MELTLSEVPALERYKLLIGLVIPRPIACISTINEHGVANCAPFSLQVETQPIGRGMTRPMSTL